MARFMNTRAASIVISTVLSAAIMPAQANSGSVGDPEDNGRFGGWIIDALFQSGTITEQPATQGLIGTIIWPLSIACTVVALIIIALKSIQHLLVVAQAKDVDASPISMTWSPIHICFAIALCLPFPSGYTAGQYFAIWLAHQSNHLGNITSDRTARFFNEQGVPNPPPLPSAPRLVKSLINSAMCMEINNNVHEFMEGYSNSSAARVIPRAMTAEEIERNKVNMTSGNFVHHGITFEREGENIIANGAAAGHCGGIIVSFSTDNFDLLEVGPARPNGVGNLEVGEIDQPGITQLWGLVGPSEETQTNQARLFSQANNRIREELLAIAQSPELASIAKNLLYDQQGSMGATTDPQDQNYLETLARETKDRTLQSASGAYVLTDRLQNMMFSAYAEALSGNVTTESAEGERWTDSIERVGWPILGLYWFQMSSTNQSILEAMALKVTPISDQGRGILDLARLTNDEMLVARVQQRFAIFESAYAQKLRNTRLDAQVVGDRSDENAAALTKVQEQESAMVLRDMFPMVKDSLIENAGQMSSRDGIMGFFDEITRNKIFPWIVNSLREDHIVTSLVETGHNIIAVAEAAYFADKLFEGWSGTEERSRGVLENDEDESLWDMAKSGLDSIISSTPVIGTIYQGGKAIVYAVTETIKDALGLIQWLIFPALFMAFYLPSMIMIQWLTGLVTWMLYIVEATIVIPLWGILFVSDLGQQAWAPQSARQGFVHFLSILIYPSLMVIGFMVAYQILDLTSIFFIDFLLIGFMNATAGYTFGIVSMVAGLFIIAIACYQIIMRVFSITLELNDRIISWIGQRMSYGETGVEQQARAGMMAVVGKLEMVNRPGMKGSGASDLGGGESGNPRGRIKTK